MSIEVAAAVIIRDNKLLATQRGYGDYKDWWEFPGGKIEPGESPEEALKREIREELDAEISIGEKFISVEYDYPKFHLVMHCFLCELESDEVVLKEHESAKWLCKDEFNTLRWLGADIEVLEKLKEIM